MLIFFRLVLILIIFTTCVSCNEKIFYSGKVLNEKKFNFAEFRNKEEVINKLGNPNYIDPIETKYYYFSERKNVKNFFEQQITNRTLVVFTFNKNDTIRLVSQYDLNDEKDIKYIKERTPNELIQTGIIKKIFGGIGNTTPINTQ